MPDPEKILVLQTAFLGDVILTLPLIQSLKKIFPNCVVDVMVIPRAAEALRNHPDINRIIEYDKRKSESGLRGLAAKIGELRNGNYDVAFVPHRSLRSAGMVYLSAIPIRIGFTTSAGKLLFTSGIQYRKDQHEYRRNLDLLNGIGKEWKDVEFPRLYPSHADRESVQNHLKGWGDPQSRIIGIAPGSVWNTKRWLPEKFTELAKLFVGENHMVVLIGGKEDERLCEEICREIGSNAVRSFAGKLSILESAELIRRCAFLISNDSAPVHMALGVGTSVGAIFGATVPAIGFAPYGPRDMVIEFSDLSCRPCSIHGGNKCPIGTFDCMKGIEAGTIFRRVIEKLG